MFKKCQNLKGMTANLVLGLFKQYSLQFQLVKILIREILITVLAAISPHTLCSELNRESGPSPIRRIVFSL